MESCPSWSKEHDWKSCNRQKRFVGSNPMLSAKRKRNLNDCAFVFYIHKLPRNLNKEESKVSMKITALVENTTHSKLKAKHGLSLYIETKKHNVLFDLGPDNTLFENAEKMDIDLSNVDTVVISHGHIDHGGALKKFLKINRTAKIYIQRTAFEPHYSKTLFFKIPVGIDESLRDNEQIVLLDGDFKIDEELFLFTVSETKRLYSPVNGVLYDARGKDTFAHEQNLIVTENETALIMGCGHAGIANIMERAKKYEPRLCVGGYHLYNPVTKKSVSQELLSGIADELEKYRNTEFYTCHCTGEKAFSFFAGKLTNMHYISCGDVVEA